MEVDTYLVRPSIADSAVRTVIALVPMAALSVISHHLDRRGAWLLLPWAALAAVAALGMAANFFFTVGLSASSAGFVFGLMSAVQIGAALAVLVTTVVLAIVGRRKI